MSIKTKLAIFAIVSLLAMAFFATAIPQAQATTTKVTFTASGYSNCSGTVLTIDGQAYSASNLPKIFNNWKAGETHTVVAESSVSSYETPPKGYAFSGWTNGNGLTTASGTFTVPSSDVTVTANYVRSTVQVQFRYSGLSNLNSITVLTVDGVEYNYNSYELTGQSYQMTIGSTHTITAASSLTGYDNVNTSVLKLDQRQRLNNYNRNIHSAKHRCNTNSKLCHIIDHKVHSHICSIWLL